MTLHRLPDDDRPEGWAPAERAAWAVCAATLSTGGLWWGLLSACAALQLAASLLAPTWGQPASPALVALAWLLGALLTWLAGTWLAMRVALDAQLMRDMARGDQGPLPDAQALDQALHTALHVPVRASRRTAADRLRGALRLHRCLVMAAVCEVLGLLLRGLAPLYCC
ncbi:MAG: hypothetical protein RI907_1509 [Pseudomonadota bacterium]|jgi:hypothetical protein